jgi:hypothetical protein
MGIRVFKDMDIIVHFLAAVQKPRSTLTLFIAFPPIPFCTIAMPGGKKKVGIVLSQIAPLARVEVINFHALAPTGTVSVLHRIGTAVFKILCQTIQGYLPVIVSGDDLRWKVTTSDSWRGI